MPELIDVDAAQSRPARPGGMRLMTVGDGRGLARSDRARGGAAATPTRPVEATVRAILEVVPVRGDAALLEFTERFDGVRLAPRDGAGAREECDAAERALDPTRPGPLPWRPRASRPFTGPAPRVLVRRGGRDRRLGQEVRPLERVAVYVPGGPAAYPSTVLMNVVPAAVAGVPRIAPVPPAGRDKS